MQITPQLEQLAARLPEMRKQVTLKAASDPAFRAALVANPSSTLETEFGLAAGTLHGIPFHVVEVPRTAVTLVIPASGEGDGELSEEEIAGISAGSSSGSTWPDGTPLPWSPFA